MHYMNIRLSKITLQIAIILITMLLFLQFFFSYPKAQLKITFNPTNEFEIPANNSSIRFGFNGTYTEAYLEDNMWTFKNLKPPNSEETETYNFKVSATDSYINITTYRIYNRVYEGENTTSAALVYRVKGNGTQAFILELNPNNGAYAVIIDGKFESLNHGWKLSQEGNPIVTGAKEFASIFYYGYPESYINRTDSIEEHSVLIVSTVFFVLIIILTSLVAIRKNQKKPLEKRSS